MRFSSIASPANGSTTIHVPSLGELLVHVARGARRVAHVVQRVEHAHQIERPPAEVLGRGDLEAHAVGDPGALGGGAAASIDPS